MKVEWLQWIIPHKFGEYWHCKVSILETHIRKEYLFSWHCLGILKHSKNGTYFNYKYMVFL